MILALSLSASLIVKSRAVSDIAIRHVACQTYNVVVTDRQTDGQTDGRMENPLWYMTSSTSHVVGVFYSELGEVSGPNNFSLHYMRIIVRVHYTQSIGTRVRWLVCLCMWVTYWFWHL